MVRPDDALSFKQRRHDKHHPKAKHEQREGSRLLLLGVLGGSHPGKFVAPNASDQGRRVSGSVEEEGSFPGVPCGRWLAKDRARCAGSGREETWASGAITVDEGWLRSRQASCTPQWQWCSLSPLVSVVPNRVLGSLVRPACSRRSSIPFRRLLCLCTVRAAPGATATSNL